MLDSDILYNVGKLSKIPTILCLTRILKSNSNMAKSTIEVDKKIIICYTLY